MDQLINQVAERTGLSPDKAREAVQVVVGFLKSKLPGPIAAQIDGALGGQQGAGDVSSQSQQGAGDVAGQAQQALGDIFGKHP